MKRLFDNLVIDLFAAALMIGMTATGYILRFPLPPGSNKSLSLCWGLSRHQWGDVHFWIGFALSGVLLLHIALHWQWLVISVRRKLSDAKAPPGGTWFSGLATLVILGAAMTLFAWAAHHGVREVTEQREGVCPPPSEGQKDKRPEVGSPPASATGSGKRSVTFWNDVYPVLERSCLACHGPNKQRGGFRVDQREDFFGRGGDSPLVIPGKSEDSPLIAIVSGKREIARRDVHQIADVQVELLRVWVDAGADWPERPPVPH